MSNGSFQISFISEFEGQAIKFHLFPKISVPVAFPPVRKNISAAQSAQSFNEHQAIHWKLNAD